MTEQEKEYKEFYEKFIKSAKEFLDEFNKLSPENKQRFQSEVFANMPLGMANLQNFLTTKFSEY